MQARQKNWICLGIAVMVVLGMYPPWVSVFPVLAGHVTATRPIGYAWLFSSPPPSNENGLAIDLARLLVEWAIVGLLTAGFVLWSGRRDS